MTERFWQDPRGYEHGRPGFPPAARNWLLRDLRLGPGHTVVELGAGTGKFTPLLSGTGAEVVAVDPAATMLARLAVSLPLTKAVLGSAQALPLRDAIADAVVCAQSFHWFATRAALAEIRRVLKPGGMLGLIWNVRDRSVEWVDALSRLVDRHENGAPRYDDGEWRCVFPAAGFGAMQETSAAHEHTGDPEQVIVARTASVSFVAALPAEHRVRLLDDVRALIAATPALAGRTTVNMPYITRMYWCRAVELED